MILRDKFSLWSPVLRMRPQSQRKSKLVVEAMPPDVAVCRIYNADRIFGDDIPDVQGGRESPKFHIGVKCGLNTEKHRNINLSLLV